MKQILSLIALLALLMQGAVINNTWAAEADPIPLIIIPGGNGGNTPPPGDPGGDGSGSGGEDPRPKSPVLMPTIIQDGYTLYIISGCAGSTLQLLDEFETVVYSTTITDETEEITLPSTLSGTYEIRLIRGSLTFGGEIEL